MAFSKNLALLAASGALCAEAVETDITVKTTKGTTKAGSLSTANTDALKAALLTGIKEYTTASKCDDVKITNSTTVTNADDSSKFDWEIAFEGEGTLCVNSLVSAELALDKGEKFVKAYNAKNIATTGQATTATGISVSSSGVTGLGAMIASVTAAVMMMAL